MKKNPPLPKKAIESKALTTQTESAPRQSALLPDGKDHPSKIAPAAPEPKNQHKKPTASAPEIAADQLLRAQGLPLLSTAYLIVRNLSRSVDDTWDGTLLGEFGKELYVLKRKGNKFEAYPTVSLADHRLQILRRNSFNPVPVTQIVDALLFSGYLQTLHPDLSGSVEFDLLKKDAYECLASSIGGFAFSSVTAIDKRGAEKSADDAVALFYKAQRAIVNLNAVTSEDPVLWKKYRAVAAIEIGANLCADLERLPTKKEVRDAMEAKGLAFGRSKGLYGKWKDVFENAGLGDLKD